jgi:hypothetical protein
MTRSRASGDGSLNGTTDLVFVITFVILAS